MNNEKRLAVSVIAIVAIGLLIVVLGALALVGVPAAAFSFICLKAGDYVLEEMKVVSNWAERIIHEEERTS